MPSRAPVSSWAGTFAGLLVLVGAGAGLAVALRTNGAGEHPSAALGIALVAVVLLLGLAVLLGVEALRRLEAGRE